VADDSVPVGEADLLTLQEAADRLKVHYMTAYRWVRKGELPAFKAGGRLRVRADELERFVSARQVEVGLPNREAGRTDWALHLERLYDLLLSGRGVEASTLVRKIVADGAPAGEVYIKLLTPVLHRIGVDWQQGRISVAEEHRATEISAAIMARLSEHFRRRGPSRGTAVTMTPPEEQHALGAAMAADFLRASGFDVHHLGANVPVEDLRLFLQVVPTDVLCVSITTPLKDAQALRGIVHAANGSHPVHVVVGGQGVTPEEAESAGALHIGDLEELARRVATLDGP
jgi:MerR family transcriptional regulator, light-induced transcriptional regulator